MVANLEIYLPICILKIGKTTNKMGKSIITEKQTEKKLLLCQFLHTGKSPEKIRAPNFHDFFLCITSTQHFGGNIGKLAHIGTTINAATTVEIAANSHIIDTHKLFYMVDVIDIIGYSWQRFWVFFA